MSVRFAVFISKSVFPFNESNQSWMFSSTKFILSNLLSCRSTVFFAFFFLRREFRFELFSFAWAARWLSKAAPLKHANAKNHLKCHSFHQHFASKSTLFFGLDIYFADSISSHTIRQSMSHPRFEFHSTNHSANINIRSLICFDRGRSFDTHQQAPVPAPASRQSHPHTHSHTHTFTNSSKHTPTEPNRQQNQRALQQQQQPHRCT